MLPYHDHHPPLGDRRWTLSEELSGEAECDEVDVVAGHKGRPEAVTSSRPATTPEGPPGRGTLAKVKPPIFGMLRRGGRVAIRMLTNVNRATIAPGTLVHTDEYDIHGRLKGWRYRHQAVCHGKGEYDREDSDGFCEVHVNKIEGFWSLLRG